MSSMDGSSRDSTRSQSQFSIPSGYTSQAPSTVDYYSQGPGVASAGSASPQPALQNHA